MYCCVANLIIIIIAFDNDNFSFILLHIVCICIIIVNSIYLYCTLRVRWCINFIVYIFVNGLL